MWWEPALTSDQWFAGENETQRKMSLRPDGMKPCMSLSNDKIISNWMSFYAYM